MSSRSTDSVRSTSSLERVPIERERPAGVTIADIEDEVSRLCPDLAVDELRAKVLLFAILKEGCGIQKIQWFTHYSREFVIEEIDGLRAAGQLFTGSVSTQYLLRQVPGCQALIERITGQKVIAESTPQKAPDGYDWQKNLVKPPAPPRPTVPINQTNREERPMNTTLAIGAPETEEAQSVTCLKTPGCPRAAGHNGICKGQQLKQPRAAMKTKPARAPRAKAAKAKPAQNIHKVFPHDPDTATAARISEGHYTIEYEDETRQFKFEGLGRDEFLAALKSAGVALAGGASV